jgi:hypothetical protein
MVMHANEEIILYVVNAFTKLEAQNWARAREHVSKGTLKVSTITRMGQRYVVYLCVVLST